MSYTIKRVVVIGSGTMGGGIAAHAANAGLAVHLLDIAPRELLPEEEQRGLTLASPQVRNRIVAASLERLKKSKPAAFFTPEAAELVTIGNLEDDFERVAEGDWIVEAIVERLEPKRELMARIERVRQPASIVSSNTSGLPIASIAAATADDFKAHFLGTHFFNPPRYMKLLEVIPTAETKPEVVEFMTEFAERRLGKGVVVCKDTPNFIANRLGSVLGASTLAFVLEHKYTVEEADAILSPLIGRPKTGLFRLQDLVGLDVSSPVGENLYSLIPEDETREVLRNQNAVKLRAVQMERGRLGDKTGQGFYKKPPKGEQGEILSLDLETFEYRARREPEIPSIKEALKIKSLPARLAYVLAQDDKAGRLARHAVYHTLAYASRRIPEITDHLINVDRAMRWGYSHELGPFELWDALGVRATADAMEREGIAVARWVREMLDAGHESFHRSEDGFVSYYDPARRTYIREATDARKITLARLKSAGRVVRENRGASLVDIGEGVVCLEFHTKLNTLDEDIRNMLREAVEEVETRDWRGLVIGNDAADFSVGANLAGGISAGGFEAIERAVREMQDALMAVRCCSKPVVTAPAGRTLGGGCEVSMAGARAAAAAEAYMGLVEVGVGLIPGAGGCKELVRRIVSPPMRATRKTDPLPFLQHALQTIASAKVSTSAAEARTYGYLTDADLVVMNREHLLTEARRLVLTLANAGYAPPARSAKNCYAAGRDALAALRAGLYTMQRGGYMSEYDLHVSLKVAHVLAGGHISAGQWVDEQYFLDLEREAFVSLCGEPKTVERIKHMLTTGKPLRN
ncbi:MAG TPA: 3-hydroxyacyl-CoA dehydrogenase/enoyl-CoA hydratase family protein [Pyrinomonadaceae bacterium]|nr:3-hydroxyacyl-CoA dehydrogenase/enoyl-CoA hydratase family protein [Pyrinomonadaceae bacterium]